MLINTDYIEPAVLTGYVREALADLEVNRFTLSQFLPSRPIDDLQYRFTRGGAGLVEAATFRAYDAESAIGGREGISRVTGELPPISRKIRLGEYDRLRQRKIADDPIVDAILNDGVNMTRAVAARIELARGQALATGTVVIDEDGAVATVDFGRQANHTTAPGTLWSDTVNADVLTDLITWRDRYVTSNGEPPAVSLASTTVLRLVQRNAEVINAIAGSAAGRTRVNLAELNALLESESLPPFRVHDAQVRVAGVATRVIAENTIVMVPAPTGDPDGTDLGATLFGTTAESLEPEYGVEGDEPGIVAGTYSTKDPVALWTKAAAIGLPVLANPNLSLASVVIA